MTEFNDPVNMGTYNYADQTLGIFGIIGHGLLDVAPWGFPHNWGNIPGVPIPNTSDENGKRYKNNATAVSYYNEIETVMKHGR